MAGLTTGGTLTERPLPASADTWQAERASARVPAPALTWEAPLDL